MQDASIHESLTDKQWDRIFYRCPGAWAGIQYLNRNRLRVLSAKAPLPEIWCSDGGIIIEIGLWQ